MIQTTIAREESTKRKTAREGGHVRTSESETRKMDPIAEEKRGWEGEGHVKRGTRGGAEDPEMRERGT